jgi:hypothetical protein
MKLTIHPPTSVKMKNMWSHSFAPHEALTSFTGTTSVLQSAGEGPDSLPDGRSGDRFPVEEGLDAPVHTDPGTHPVF